MPLKFSPKELTGLAWRDEHRLSEDEQEGFTALCAVLPLLSVAHDLVLGFRALMYEQRVQDVAEWLERAKTSGVHDLKLFATSLQLERHALEAAIRLPLSNGPVEGLIHEVKLVKRLMYGRVCFPMLRTRILLTAPVHRS